MAQEEELRNGKRVWHSKQPKFMRDGVASYWAKIDLERAVIDTGTGRRGDAVDRLFLERLSFARKILNVEMLGGIAIFTGLDGQFDSTNSDCSTTNQKWKHASSKTQW